MSLREKSAAGWDRENQYGLDIMRENRTVQPAKNINTAGINFNKHTRRSQAYPLRVYEGLLVLLAVEMKKKIID